MKRVNLLIWLTIRILTACGQGKITTPVNAMDKFENEYISFLTRKTEKEFACILKNLWILLGSIVLTAC